MSVREHKLEICASPVFFCVLTALTTCCYTFCCRQCQPNFSSATLSRISKPHSSDIHPLSTTSPTFDCDTWKPTSIAPQARHVCNPSHPSLGTSRFTYKQPGEMKGDQPADQTFHCNRSSSRPECQVEARARVPVPIAQPLAEGSQSNIKQATRERIQTDFSSYILQTTELYRDEKENTGVNGHT